MSEMQQGSWTKPAAMAIPKGGYFGKPEQGRYGPIFPKTPGVLRLLHHRKADPREVRKLATNMPRTIEEAVAKDRQTASPCSSCTICAGRFSRSTGKSYFQYQGIFDTDFDKYTEDAVALFSAAGILTVFENLEGFPKDWKTKPEGFIKFVRDHHCPSFLEYGEYPYVSADEIKKALKLKAAFSNMLDQMQ